MQEAETAGRSLELPALLDPGRWTRALLEASDDASSRTPGFDDVQLAIGQLTRGTEREPGREARRPAAMGELPLDRAEVTAGQQARGGLEAQGTQGRAPGVVLPGFAGAAALRAQLLAAATSGRGATGARLPDEVAARLGPHVGSEAAGTARLHTDDIADRIAAAHHARAVALGDAIYFAHGEYAPGTERGDELLAHELTHVAQARRGALTRAAAKGLDAGGTLDPAEAEADLRAKLAVIQLHPPAGAAPPLAVPSGQPTSDGDRAAKLAAQQQRLNRANQAAAPLAVAPAPPASRPQAPVVHPPPPMAAAPAPATRATPTPTRSRRRRRSRRPSGGHRRARRRPRRRPPIRPGSTARWPRYRSCLTAARPPMPRAGAAARRHPSHRRPRVPCHRPCSRRRRRWRRR
jgi:hypothetical protein